MTIAFDKATSTYSNGIRVGDVVECHGGGMSSGEGIVTAPKGVCYGIYADWVFDSGYSKDGKLKVWGFMPEEVVYLRAPIEVLGDNDDDCI